MRPVAGKEKAELVHDRVGTEVLLEHALDHGHVQDVLEQPPLGEEVGRIVGLDVAAGLVVVDTEDGPVIGVLLDDAVDPIDSGPGPDRPAAGKPKLHGLGRVDSAALSLGPHPDRGLEEDRATAGAKERLLVDEDLGRPLDLEPLAAVRLLARRGHVAASPFDLRVDDRRNPLEVALRVGRPLVRPDEAPHERVEHVVHQRAELQGAEPALRVDLDVIGCANPQDLLLEVGQRAATEHVQVGGGREDRAGLVSWVEIGRRVLDQPVVDGKGA